MNRKWTRIAVLAGVLAPSFASATLLIDDGGTHVFGSAVAQSTFVTNGSTVRLTSGGSITGDGTSPAPGPARGALSTGPFSNSNIYLEGNAVVSGGADRFGISRLYSGQLHLSGDSIVNAGASGYAIGAEGYGSDHETSLLRMFLTDHAFVNGSVESDGFISISDNAIINGNLHESYAGMALRMDGGLITGSVGTSSLVDHSVIISSGTILGGFVGNASDLDFSMHDGRVVGRWQVNAVNQDVTVFGGRLDGGMEFGYLADNFARSAQVSIFGGAIDVTSGDYLFDFNYAFDEVSYSSATCGANTSSFDIWGGQLGYASAGLGLHLDYCATIDVYGRNLDYSSGWLTGQLADGSLINLAVTEESRWGGMLRLHDVSVPEPGTLGLLGMALGAMAMTRRRRIATA